MDTGSRYPRRKTLRLPDYDYSQPGAYFITLLTYRRQQMLCDILDGEPVYTRFGLIVKDSWMNLVQYHARLRLDEFCIMPDHLHGILWLVEDSNGGSTPIDPRVSEPATEMSTASGLLSEIIRGFKSFSARKINTIRGTTGSPVWQRGFYEHVISGEDELNQIRQYILENPLKWQFEQSQQS